RYFKEKTTGHTIIMGRKTFDSLGRVLPNRKHLVLTRSERQFPEGVEVFHDIDDVLQYVNNNTDEEIIVIGGGQLFKMMLPHVDKMYITEIDEEFAADVYFPSFKDAEWELTSKEKGPKD